MTTFVTLSCWKHFNCYHYIIIFGLMPISHICIIWTVSYELLPSISNFTFVLVDFLLTSDYLSSCFCRLLYWETTTDLEGSTFSRLKYSILFYRMEYSLSHFWSSRCICVPANIFLSFLSYWFFLLISSFQHHGFLFLDDPFIHLQALSVTSSKVPFQTF